MIALWLLHKQSYMILVLLQCLLLMERSRNILPRMPKFTTPSPPVNRHGYAIIDIREIVPAVGVAEGVGGLPFALFGAVVAEEKGVAEFAHQRLAGEEGVHVVAFAEGGHLDRMIGVLVFYSQGVAQMIVEENLVAGEHRVAAGYRGFIQKFRVVTAARQAARRLRDGLAQRARYCRRPSYGPIEVVTEVCRHFSRLRN